MRSNEPVIGSSDCQALGAPVRQEKKTDGPSTRAVPGSVYGFTRQGADGKFQTVGHPTYGDIKPLGGD
jgi:hypothetical protein